MADSRTGAGNVQGESGASTMPELKEVLEKKKPQWKSSQRPKLEQLEQQTKVLDI